MPSLSRLPAFHFGPAVAALLIFAPWAASAASFPCEKAKTAVELEICRSPEVSDLDEDLGRYYAAARMALKHADECLVTDQKHWLQATRNQCKDADCLKRAYLRRLSELHAVQPGATVLRNLELPAEPSLVWIIPAAADQVAAPRHRRTTPLVGTGRIVNEVAAGDGYVLDTGVGGKLLIASLMLLEEPTADALAQLSKNASGSYQVRGRTDESSSPPVAFAPSQCTYVYRAAQ